MKSMHNFFMVHSFQELSEDLSFSPSHHYSSDTLCLNFVSLRSSRFRPEGAASLGDLGSSRLTALLVFPFPTRRGFLLPWVAA